MPAVFLDEDVHAFIVRNAKLYVDKSESDTLRRLLKIETGAPRPAPASERSASARSKKPKVDLFELKRSGLLRQGQKLFLHDYRGQRLDGMTAEVGPANKLVWSGRRYSMSALASTLLKRSGFQADSVRGPAHWFTEDGSSVLSLWQRPQNTR